MSLTDCTQLHEWMALDSTKGEGVSGGEVGGNDRRLAEGQTAHLHARAPAAQELCHGAAASARSPLKCGQLHEGPATEERGGGGAANEVQEISNFASRQQASVG